MPKKKWDVTVEKDSDLKPTLFKKSCVLCKNGNREIAKTCVDCIISKNYCNFKPLKKSL